MDYKPRRSESEDPGKTAFTTVKSIKKPDGTVITETTRTFKVRCALPIPCEEWIGCAQTKYNSSTGCEAVCPRSGPGNRLKLTKVLGMKLSCSGIRSFTRGIPGLKSLAGLL